MNSLVNVDQDITTVALSSTFGGWILMGVDFFFGFLWLW